MASRCLLVASAFLFHGCNKSEAPAPISAEQVQPAVSSAFEKAAPEVKTMATDAAASLTTDPAKAFVEFQALSSKPDLTPEQREVAAQSMVTANQRLQQAAAAGDKRAQDLLQLHRASK